MFHSLTEAKVAKYEKDPEVNQPEFKALKDPNIAILAGGSATDLAATTFAKGLLAEIDYHHIISGGNETKWFVTSLLNTIASGIQNNPTLLETFITEVLDRIGPPVSKLGEQLRKSISLNSFSTHVHEYYITAHACNSTGF